MYVGHGFSKVMRPDKWDDQKGIELAFVKACGDLVTTMMNDGLWDLDFIEEYLEKEFPKPNPSDDPPVTRDHTVADLAYDLALSEITYSSDGPFNAERKNK